MVILDRPWEYCDTPEQAYNWGVRDGLKQASYMSEKSHAYWALRDYNWPYCTHCQTNAPMGMLAPFDYCPHCGAVMDEAKDEAR